MNIERKIELQGMPFDKAEMTPDNVKELDQFLADLKPVTLGAVIVTGHTDRIGSLTLQPASVRASRGGGQGLRRQQGRRSEADLLGG